MRANIIIFIFMFGIVFGYYSAKLNKIHMPKIPNNNETNDDNRTQINLTKEQIKRFGRIY